MNALAPASNVVPEKPRQSRPAGADRAGKSARAARPLFSAKFRATALSSIEALAREVRACNDFHQPVHELRGGEKQFSRAYDRSEAGISQLYDREEALESLIATMPAQNLSDAAVHLGLIMTTLDPHDRGIHDDLTVLDAADIAQIHADIRKVVRLTISVLHAVLANAEPTAGELLSEWHLDQWEIRFGALAQVERGAA